MVLMTVSVREKLCCEFGRIGFLGLTVEDREVKTVNKERCGSIRWSVFMVDGTRKDL